MIPEAVLEDELPEPRPWHGMIWAAWAALKFDRAYPGMGGEMPVSWSTLRTYADHHGILGADFEFFVTMMRGIDDEYLLIRAEQRRRTEAQRTQ